jgi:hypothetical protein
VEHVLPAAVIVEPAATVVVQITPPLSPDRKPWNVRLQRILVADGALDPRATGRATELGTWSVEGVERGPYSIEVFDSAGSTVARLQQEIRRDTATIDVQVGRVRVEGRLRFGTEPVSAELEFFTRASNVVMHSDEDGVFAGWLPNEGPWGVQIIPKGELQRLRARVDVHVPSDATRATVDIDLPNGRIEGMVVDEAGNAVPKSGLIVLKGSEVLANTGTDGDGRFVVRGLETGPVVLFAKRGELFSDYQKAQITTESGEKETVVLRAPTELTGKLVHPSGAAVIGALIRYLRNSEILTAVSGPTGGFALNLAFDADFADLIVMTPGRPVVLDRVRLGREKAFVVVPEVAAELRILPRIGASLPWISKAQGPLFPLTLLFGPRQGLEQPREFSNGVITLQVAPGMYNVCYSYSVAADCVAVAARAGEVTRAVPPTNVGAK